jgi:isoquinoline 1-oxidoreductase beta subunit
MISLARGQPLPKSAGRGVSVQFAFAGYMAQVAEVEVSPDGTVRVRRVCAVDCGTAVNPKRFTMGRERVSPGR